MAPSYIAAVVGIIMQVQHLVGWDFANDQWTAVVTILVSVFIAIRQLATGRATLAGMRPEDFEG